MSRLRQPRHPCSAVARLHCKEPQHSKPAALQYISMVVGVSLFLTHSEPAIVHPVLVICPFSLVHRVVLVLPHSSPVLLEQFYSPVVTRAD
jgi:hypothetical protein